ncbi:ejaculatory bulb-specific protein 3-like [Polyergus mexicanus]|uniref:ejaculatory bulb-specific protein 3-like n=1 Tax=Polyergus mexicanus TaxID=615972 RepID=UPI0038B42D53
MIRLVTLISIALLCVFAEELYSDKYDYIDMKEILKNHKLRVQYYQCVMETGPCLTEDAKFIKEISSEAFQTKCKKCTEKQKKMLDIIVDWYTQNEPELWQKFVKKSLEDMKKKNAGQ